MMNMMKSIDKLHSTFPAGLSQDKWHTSNVGHDAAKGFESVVSCKCVVHRKPEATYTFRSKNNQNFKIQSLSRTLGNSRDLSLVS